MPAEDSLIVQDGFCEQFERLSIQISDDHANWTVEKKTAFGIAKRGFYQNINANFSTSKRLFHGQY